jgi:hypothetical protein
MNLAQHVQQAAAWFPDPPAILFEDRELRKSATGKILERLLRGR